MALLLPLLLLGLLEVGLRIAGAGYDTRFLKKAQVNGREYFINNDTFSLRFFPPALARWPGTLMVPATKPPGTIRVFIFGESAAMGDPQPAYGASRYLEVLLRHRFPETKFEIINVAFTAINSHVILPIARECSKREGDIWIIYMGNNEMVGPFGAATVFGSQAPPRAMVRFNLALQETRLGQLAMSAMRQLSGKSANTTWGGMQMFLQNQIPPDDPRRETVYHNFAANLRDIVAAGLESGAMVILNTMSVNLRDCPPFASMNNSNLPAAELSKFNDFFSQGRALENASNHVKAAELFAEAYLSGRPETYEARWREDFGADLSRAAQMRRRFYGNFWGAPFTERMIEFARGHRGVKRVLGDLVAGEQGYVDLKKKLLRSAFRPV